MKKTFGALLLVLYAAGIGVGVWVAWKKPARLAGAIPLPEKDKVALVHLEGTITSEALGGRFLAFDLERTLRRLRKHREDAKVKAVVLRLNSPGGTVASVQEIYAEIQRLRKEGKKVVASMGDVAASGAYYIAAACDKVVANPGSLTGSIGVILQLAEVEGLLAKVGARIVTIKSGEYKDIGDWSRAIKPKEREILQRMIEEAHAQFVDAVARGRKIPPAQAKEISDGRIWLGSQAKAIGLVDELGGLREAIELAKEISGAKDAKVVEDIPPWQGILRMLPEERAGWAGLPPLRHGIRIAYLLPTAP